MIRSSTPLADLGGTRCSSPGSPWRQTPICLPRRPHAPQFSFTGTGYDLQLLEWLTTYTFPAEAKFKELGEALDILTDEFKRKLWDEGHDLDAIAQRVQMREQQQGRR